MRANVLGGKVFRHTVEQWPLRGKNEAGTTAILIQRLLASSLQRPLITRTVVLNLMFDFAPHNTVLSLFGCLGSQIYACRSSAPFRITKRFDRLAPVERLFRNGDEELLRAVYDFAVGSLAVRKAVALIIEYHTIDSSVGVTYTARAFVAYRVELAWWSGRLGRPEGLGIK